MVDWNKIKEQIESLSISEVLEKHLDTPEKKAIVVRTKQVAEFHRVYGKLLEKIPWPKISASEESFLIVSYILFMTEGLLSFGMNVIIYALMLKEHHDIWSEWKNKFVSSYDELSEVRLSARLKFLERHGFGFFSEICPKDIRNAIAHMNFIIDSKGTIHLKRPTKQYTKEELQKKIEDIVKMVSLFNEVWGP